MMQESTFDRCIEEADYFRRMADRMKQRQDRVQVALILCSALALTCASFTDIPLVVHPVLPAINAIVVILTSLMAYFQWGRHAQEYRETFSRMAVEFDQYIRHRGKYAGLSHDQQLDILFDTLHPILEAQNNKMFQNSVLNKGGKA